MDPVKASRTSTAEHHPAENDPLEASHAPKPAHPARRYRTGDRRGDHDPLRSPYAPKNTDKRSGIGPQDAAAPPQPAHGELHEGPAAPHGGESNSDLDRLEASLRWLQRQEAATQLAHKSQPPVLASPHAAARHGGGELLGSRPPASLEPVRMGPPPLAARRNRLVWPLRILIAGCVTAPALYYISGAGEKRGPAPEPALHSNSLRSSFKQRFDAPGSIGQVIAEPIGSGDVDSGGVPTGLPSTGETVASPQPTAETPAPSKPVRMLDPKEIALLLKQGEQLVAAGDLATARTVFQRAAEADDATAAAALAGTYDPAVLKRLGVVGMDPDVEKARRWYQKAESLGSAVAGRRLQALANP